MLSSCIIRCSAIIPPIYKHCNSIITILTEPEHCLVSDLNQQLNTCISLHSSDASISLMGPCQNAPQQSAIMMSHDTEHQLQLYLLTFLASDNKLVA